MDRFQLKGYLNRVNEYTVINFAKNYNIHLSFLEASQGLYFMKTHFDQLLNCYDKKEYIYYYLKDPFAYKVYTLINILVDRLKIR